MSDTPQWKWKGKKIVHLSLMSEWWSTRTSRLWLGYMCSREGAGLASHLEGTLLWNSAILREGTPAATIFIGCPTQCRIWGGSPKPRALTHLGSSAMFSLYLQSTNLKYLVCFKAVYETARKRFQELESWSYIKLGHLSLPTRYCQVRMSPEIVWGGK